MPNIFEVTPKDIQDLTDIQLTNLLLRLLYLEASRYEIPAFCVGGSLNITASDGGEDARIKWEEAPNKTDCIPNRFTVFQCKATDMPESKCKNEMLIKESKDLKPRVEEVFDAAGCYILFYGKNCNTQHQEPRIKAFREAIKDAGKPYHQEVQIVIYDSNKIANWVNNYISAVTTVLGFVGRLAHDGFLTWQQWEGYEYNKNKYIKHKILDDYMRQLQLQFDSPRKVARIVGLSGLGKTRLALEAFRPPENPSMNFAQQSRSDQVVYCDAENCSNLPAIVAKLRNHGLSGILIVDNCEKELHQKLEIEFTHRDSSMSLLTLDFNPESPLTDIPYLHLEPLPDEVIKGILKESYPGFREPEINRIVYFAQGFPMMAVLLAGARLNEEDDVGSLRNDILVERLLWGRSLADPQAKEVISACALFEHLGYTDEVAEQRHFTAKEICGIDSNRFYEITQDFIQRKILDKRHRYVRVVPRPLAIRLAADWWRKCAPERGIQIFSENMPKGMIEALCDQMSKLHFLPEARERTKDLCGEQAPFGQAEVLNSEKGSRLFRALVEVNPHATVSALERVFGNWETKQLRQVGPGRRNLVGALEKLCFWEDTFVKASRLMLAFAAAENENWGNNATGLFLQLFHIYLSGTQASPALRLQIIKESLASDKQEYKVLAAQALGSALHSSHFSRSGGVEIQGSRPPQQDWYPKQWKDVFDYWHECISLLTPFATEESELGEIARVQIVRNFRGLVQHGQMDDLNSILLAIFDKRGYDWPALFQGIQDCITYEGPKIPQEGQKQLFKWLEMMKPKTLEEKLRMLVSMPNWNRVKEEDGHYKDIAEEEAVEFANECAKKLHELYPHIRIILEGEQRMGFVFGKTLGELVENPQEFIEHLLADLTKISSEKANGIVLGGFLFSVRPKLQGLFKETMDVIAETENLHIHLITLTSLTKPEKDDLERVLKIVKQGKISPGNLRTFAWGSTLSHLEPKTIAWLCQEIGSIDSASPLFALEILVMYCYRDRDKFESCRSSLRDLLSKPGLLSEAGKSDTHDDYNWQQAVEKFLNAEPKDDELAKHIATEMLAACDAERFELKFDIMLRPILKILLERYLDLTWPIFSKGLLSTESMVSYNLSHIFYFRLDSMDSSSVLLDSVSPEFLVKWCETYSDKAPLVLLQLIPTLRKRNDTWEFQPIVRYIIDNYGNRREILSAIDSTLGSYSWSGSIIPYYQRQVDVFETLLSHENAGVRNWAKRNIEYLTKQIQKEEQWEGEREAGIY